MIPLSLVTIERRPMNLRAFLVPVLWSMLAAFAFAFAVLGCMFRTIRREARAYLDAGEPEPDTFTRPVADPVAFLPASTIFPGDVVRFNTWTTLVRINARRVLDALTIEFDAEPAIVTAAPLRYYAEPDEAVTVFAFGATPDDAALDPESPRNERRSPLRTVARMNARDIRRGDWLLVSGDEAAWNVAPIARVVTISTVERATAHRRPYADVLGDGDARESLRLFYFDNGDRLGPLPLTWKLALVARLPESRAHR